MNMKFKLQVWIDQNRGLYVLGLNILPSIMAFFSPFKYFRCFEYLMIGDMIEVIFYEAPIKLGHLEW
jgi:hypothetical protein